MEQKPKVSFLIAVKNGFRNYVNFKGRIRRSEYWFFVLLINSITAIFVILLVLFFKKVIYKTDYDPNDYPDYYLYEDFNDHMQTTKILIIIGVFSFYLVSIVIPLMSATVRRLHDVGKSGIFIFVGLIPFFGGLYLLYLLCLDSMKDSNEFGLSPKYNIINSENQLVPLIK